MAVKLALRSFGIGLFVAGASLSVFQTFDETKLQEPTKATETIAKDAIVMKKSDVDKLNEQIDKLEVDNKKLLQNSPKYSSTEPKIETYTLNVQVGMGTREVSKELKKANIIEDADKFEAYIINAGKSSTIQLGKTTLNSNMTQEDILNALTKRK